MKSNHKSKLFRGLVTTSLVVASAAYAHAQKSIMKNESNLSAEFNSTKSTEDYPNLIDNNPDTKYWVNGKKALWVQYNAEPAAVVNQYSITSANDSPGRDPKNWTLQVSTDNMNWKDLDVQKDQVFAERKETKTYKLANKAPYKYYRLKITENSGENAIQFSEWTLDFKK